MFIPKTFSKRMLFSLGPLSTKWFGMSCQSMRWQGDIGSMYRGAQISLSGRKNIFKRMLAYNLLPRCKEKRCAALRYQTNIPYSHGKRGYMNLLCDELKANNYPRSNLMNDGLTSSRN